jgi:hypothetical protein
MSLLLYVIAEGDADATDVIGLDGSPLEGIGYDGLVAWVSDREAHPSPTPETLWEYEMIVELLMARFTVLPARFGSAFADEAAAQAVLRARRDQLKRDLSRVRGAAELGVRARWRRVDDFSVQSVADTGTAYMLGRLELDRHARRIAHALEPLRALARSSKRRVLPRPTVPILAAYLVERGRVEEFTRLVSRLGERLEEVTLACTGPWPPYSFAHGSPS